MMELELDQPDSSQGYIRQFTNSKIYPVTCLIQTYREYALFVTTVSTDDHELTEGSLISLVKAEVSLRFGLTSVDQYE